jgi:hypothetical protein
LAKKRRQKIEKKEDYIFKPPEYEKSEFIRNELRNAKATLLAFIFAIFMAMISYGFLRLLDDFRVGAVVGLFGIVGLPVIYSSLKIDMAEFEKKTWLGVGAVYIFAWLMISMLIVNPPLTDLAEPQINEISIEELEINVTTNVTTRNWVPVVGNSDGDISIKVNATFRITAEIIDNGALESNSVRCELISIDNQVHTLKKSSSSDYKYAFEYNQAALNLNAGTYQYKIYAKDESGNDAVSTGIIILTI